MKKVLLYSGGMDSWLISKIWKPDIKLYINLHTNYSDQEIKNLDKDVVIEDFDLSRFERDDKIIPLRNLYLIMLATNYGDEICLGATAGDRVLDKSPKFSKMTSELLTYLFSPQWWNPVQRNIKVNLDFKNKTKTELLKMFIDQGGDIKDAWYNSFSCYYPINGTPCMKCKPCFRKFISFAECGFVDENWLPVVIPYIEKNILPQIKNNTYNRGEKEENQILEIYKKFKK